MYRKTKIVTLNLFSFCQIHIKDLTAILGLTMLFALMLVFKHPDIISYRFNDSLIDKYFKCQDIPYDIHGRVFLSDGDIYIAAGYLYAKGENPINYNFQHPPLIKYLFGLSTIYFNNPYYVQIVLAIFLITATYLLGRVIFDSPLIGVIASLFLIADPLFWDVTRQALLDLGQTVFLALYFLMVAVRPKNYLLQGIILGFLFTSKFWSASLMLIIAFTLLRYILFKNKKEPMVLFRALVIAGVVFILVYTKLLLDTKSLYRLFFVQAKMLKYMLVQNSSEFFGGSGLLFFSGYYPDWYSGGLFKKSSIWSVIWPISLMTTLYGFANNLKKINKKTEGVIKKIKSNFFYYYFGLIPLFMILSSLKQYPFARYFLPVLPFLYLALAKTLHNILGFSQDTLKDYKK